MTRTQLTPDLSRDIRSIFSRLDRLEEQVRDLVPPGSMLPWGSSEAPSGYLICNGSAYSRSTYARLFQVIGIIYGSGDGSTTFNVPDLRGRVPVGADAMGVGSSGRLFTPNTIGTSGGEQTHTLTIPEMPSHGHTIKLDFTGAGTDDGRAARMAGNFSDIQTQTAPIGLTGGDGAHNNLQPYLVTFYIIKT